MAEMSGDFNLMTKRFSKGSKLKLRKARLLFGRATPWRADKGGQHLPPMFQDLSRSEHDRSHALPVNDVEGAFLDGERGFLDGFAQGWVRMAGAAEILGAATKFHDGCGFGD